MTTDNKTLADVQPGGRVRLGDRNGSLAVSLRQIADAQYTRRQRFNGRLPADVQEVIRMAAEALSAQPSPGGQGDALELLERYDWAVSALDAELNEGWDEGGRRARLQSDRDEVRAELIAALVARQPVGEPVGYLYRVVVSEAGASRPWVGRGIVFEPGPPPHEGVRRNIQYMSVYDRPQTAQAVDLGTGIKAIASERERQLCMEGFSRDSDEQYREGELARAATAYVQLAAMDLQVGSRKHIASQEPPFFWPWAPEWWKPVDARHDLVRAGALIAAQIDLIDSQAVGK